MRVNLPKFKPLPNRYIDYDPLSEKRCIHLKLPLEINLRLQWLTTGKYKQLGKVELFSLMLSRMFCAFDEGETTMSSTLPRYLYPYNPWPKSSDW